MKRPLRIRRWFATVAASIAILSFPLPLRTSDKERIIADSALHLVNVEPVHQRFPPEGEPNGWQYMPFIESEGIKTHGLRWHLVNDTNLDCSLLQERGFLTMAGHEFRAATKDVSWYEANAALEITTHDPTGENAGGHLRFNYYYGWLGAQGFRVRAYRCLLGTWFYFEREWVS